MRCRKVFLDLRLWPCSGLCFNSLFFHLSLSLALSRSLSFSFSCSCSVCVSVCVSGPTVKKQPWCLLLWPTLFRHLACRTTADRRCWLKKTRSVSHLCSSMRAAVCPVSCSSFPYARDAFSSRQLLLAFKIRIYKPKQSKHCCCLSCSLA
jgi:hypothetical protein